MPTSLQGVMVVPNYWQHSPLLNYVYYVCRQLFGVLQARISDTRSSLSGRIRDLRSNFSSWRESFRRRITLVEGRVHDLWMHQGNLAETVSVHGNELKSLKEQLKSIEECLSRTKQE